MSDPSKLLLAIHAGDQPLALYLVKNTKLTGREQHDCLCGACWFGMRELAAYLLSLGITDKTAAECAIRGGHPEMLELLKPKKQPPAATMIERPIQETFL